MGTFFCVVIFALLAALSAAAAPPPKPVPEPSPWGEWVEADFPFFSSILDARRAGGGEKNLTPRGLVLNLGHDCWVCFDTDLLRIAAVWRGKGVTDKALAPGSYHDSFRKTPGGQFPAPQPDGKLWLANGIYPGWQTGTQAALTDPREPAPSPEEVGRGPLPEALGRFKAIRLVKEGAVLEYNAGGADVREWWNLSGEASQPVIERHLTVGALAQPLLLVVGLKSNGPAEEVHTGVTLSAGTSAEIVRDDTLWLVRVPAHEKPVQLCLTFADEHDAPAIAPRPLPDEPPALRWPQAVVSKIKPSTAQDAYVVDHIDLPTGNPWKRALRLSDIQFLKDGTGVGVT
ncbi:MAG: DUF6797 domain-containing protein, partial [Prosthecobacter sp.]|nr:DUF6797 domain-containing protein [Prosthecobacter sp.]